MSYEDSGAFNPSRQGRFGQKAINGNFLAVNHGEQGVHLSN